MPDNTIWGAKFLSKNVTSNGAIWHLRMRVPKVPSLRVPRGTLASGCHDGTPGYLVAPSRECAALAPSRGGANWHFLGCRFLDKDLAPQMVPSGTICS